MADMNEGQDRLEKIERAAVLVPPDVEEANQLAESIAAYLGEQGLTANIGNLEDKGFLAALGGGEADLIIAVGGDGTMLRAGDVGAQGGIPVLGVNLGRLGFLVEIKREGWRPALERVLSGECWVESRMRLRVCLSRGEDRIGEWEALNEGVVGRGRTGRPIRVQAKVDGRYLATYVADGLICATATGSTAYALAAGGPVLPPDLRNLLLVPVAPHLSMDRGIVLPEGARVQLQLQSDTDAELSCDGQIAGEMKTQDVVTFEASSSDARFLRLQDPGYFYRNLTSYMNSDHPSGLHS